MSKKTKIAFGCYLIIAIVALRAGIVYTTSTQIVPYHQQVVGVRWDDLEPNFKMLYLALLRGAGISGLVTGLSIALLLFIPFRRGERWSRWAITLLGLVSLVPALYNTVTLRLSTGASTPWIPSLLLLVILIAGFLLSSGLGRPGRM